jgi:hypothetical protein
MNGNLPGVITFDSVPSTLPSANGVPLFYFSPNNDALFFPNGAYGLFSGILTGYPTFINQIKNSSLGVSSYIRIGLMGAGALSEFKFKTRALNQVVTLWYEEIFNWQKCRASNRGFALSGDEFKIRYIWMLPWIINILTNPTMTFDNTQSDWFVSFNASAVLKRLTPPSTASYEHYQKTKSVSFKFTGFQSLLNSDLTLNVLIKDCPGWNIPAIYMECQGNDCDLITLPRYCTSQSYCDSNYPGTKCLSLSNTQNIDFVQAYFTHKTAPIDTCGSPSLLLDDLHKLILAYSGDSQPQQSVCFWDIDYLVNTVNITDWAEKQYIVDGDKFSIRDLSEWSPADTNIPGSAIVAGSISILVNWWLLFLLIFICWKI